MSEIPSHKNPSREQCQKIIRRILVTEVLEKGCNEHFKQASDFMSYFQSLYPASAALTKQVQRAIKAMDMPKDEKGYYIINKTSEQLDQERELKALLATTRTSVSSLDDCDTVFLKIHPSMHDYLIHLITSSITFENHYETIVPTCNGLLFYTHEKARLQSALQGLLPKD